MDPKGIESYGTEVIASCETPHMGAGTKLLRSPVRIVCTLNHETISAAQKCSFLDVHIILKKYYIAKVYREY